MEQALRPLDRENNGRNYGIDLLRLVSMFLVVLLHATATPRRNAEAGTAIYNTVYLIRTLSFPCVDIFAIISGYVGWKHRLSVSGTCRRMNCRSGTKSSIMK